MRQKEILMSLVIVLMIFSVGFVLRVESTHLSGIPDNEKAFYQDQNGLPYMYDMDSYYNYRLTKNYLDHGYFGDTIINNREWDTHSYYPPGVPLDYPILIAYITAFIYRFVNLFGNISLITTCFWMPAFVGPLGGVIAYLFVRRFTNEYGAAAAGILAVTAPFYFMRTVPGWFDTDMFNIFFPLLIVWAFFEAIETKNRRKQVFFTLLSAFSMFLFSMAWNGWQYLFYVMLLSCLIWILWLRLKGKNMENLPLVSTIFFIISILFITLFTGFLNVLKLFLDPPEILKLFGSGPWAPWPNVYILISELQIPSTGNLIFGLGPVLFLLGISGILSMALILRKEQLHKQLLGKLNWFFYLFLIIWTITGFLALIKGIRFIIMVIPPLIIISGINVGIVTGYLNFLKRKNLRRTFSVLIVVLISVPSVLVIYDNYPNLNPRMNDDLWDAGVWINENTTNDTVVISSWVYGHFFTAIADRPVIFDGRFGYIETLPVRNYDNTFVFKDKSPTTAREYWIDRAFSTSNESLSLGIFRMIATSGDTGYLTLDEYTRNTVKTVEILNNVLGVDKKTAENILVEKYNLGPDQTENVLKYTHPDNSNPFVLVTYDGMINNGYWIFHFGEWNFEKMGGEDYLYSFGNIKVDNDNLITDDGVVMDPKGGNLTWNNQTPFCTVMIEDGNLKKRYMDLNSTFCVILNMDNKKSVVIDKRFEDSLFTKLVIERSNSTFLKSSYENKNVIIWKSI